MRQFVSSIALIASFGIFQTTVASEVRHAGAHVHGLNQVQMVLDGNTLQIVYQMVAEQLDGQHAQSTHGHTDHGHKDHGHKDHGHKDHGHKDHGDNKGDRLAAVAALENYHALFHLPDAAECEQSGFESALKDVSENTHQHSHDHGDHAGHQDAILQYQFECANPKALSTIEFEAFESFADVEAIDLEALVNGRAISTRVTKDQVLVNL